MRIVICAAVIAALGACKGHKSKLDEMGSAPPPVAAGTSAAPKGDEPPRLPPVTPNKLAPVNNVLGPEGGVPTAGGTELATPIIDPQMVGGVSAKTKFVITPEIAGSLSYSGPSELTFTPARPFAFATDYKVDLQALETRDGVVAPAKGQSWTYSFKTPAFTVLGWAPPALDVEHHKVTMEVAFSGAVLPNIATAALRITVDGHALAGIAVLPAQITDPRTMLGS